MDIKIEHIIDETSKEIYKFRECGDSWDYVGIFYSHRDDADDVWGDEWSEHYADKRSEELNAVAESLGLESTSEMCGWDWDTHGHHFEEVKRKYNPVCQKTKHGKTRYSGSHGGRRDHPTPKISVDEIKAEILKQISKMEIRL
ncbi:MAG: hypothetical protein ACW99G_23410 [Candidatus Thorarchaeota archaeon]|jgi:hypothetical protein